MRTAPRSNAAARRVVLALLAATTLGACAADAPTEPALSPTAHVTPVDPIVSLGCHPDVKFIGRIELSTADLPGTWWYITREGFDAAGITDYQGFMSSVFGLPFATLDEAITYLVDAVKPLDRNGNAFVCAYEVRGELRNYGTPEVNKYIFSTTDDDHRTR